LIATVVKIINDNEKMILYSSENKIKTRVMIRQASHARVILPHTNQPEKAGQFT
jgi:hypothetical protein